MSAGMKKIKKWRRILAEISEPPELIRYPLQQSTPLTDAKSSPCQRESEHCLHRYTFPAFGVK